MTQVVKTVQSVFVLTLILVCLDFVWFKLVLDKVYTKMFNQLNNTQDFQFRPVGAVAWILLAIGIYYFALQPTPTTAKQALIQGALVGLVIYGVYNATNYATITAWTPQVWLFDNLWGIVVCALTTLIFHTLQQ